MKKWKRTALIGMAFALVTAGCGKGGEGAGTDTSGAANGADAGTIKVEAVQSGSQYDPTNTDVVIVMDKSGSMRRADSERISIEAAKMFIDMEKASGANVAIVQFSTDVLTDGLIPLDDQEAKGYLKKVLDQIEYVNLTHTDTGAALQEAVSILNNSQSGNHKAIILFTDGRTEITTGDRTLQQSEADRDAAVEEAAANGYPIYAVGLNKNNNVDEEELEKMVFSTDGRKLITSSVDELPDFFNDIFQDLGNIDEIPIDDFISDGEYHSKEFEISNNNILEANIVMLSGMQLQDVRLYSPGGEQVDLNADQFIFSSSNKYAIIKMLTPQSGTWKIEVKGIAGDQIRISLLYNYDINMITSISQAEAYKGDTIQIESYLTNQELHINDEAFYSQMTGKAIITCPDKGTVSEVELEKAADGMTGQFQIEEIAGYTVSVHMEGQGLYRDSEPVPITVFNKPVQILKDLGALSLNPGSKGEVDLSEYFSDPEGATLEYLLKVETKAGDKDVVWADIQNGMLNYEALKKGGCQLQLTVSDGNGSEVSQTVEVKVDTFFGRHRVPIIAAIAAVLALALIWLIIKSMRSAMGYLLVSVDNRCVDSFGQINSQSFQLATGLSVRSIGKSFTLAKMLQKFSGSYGAITFDQNKLQELEIVLGRIRSLAGGVKFTPTKDKKKMKVTIKGKNVYFSDISGTSMSNKKVMMISGSMSNSTTFYIKIKTGNDESENVVIKINYSMNAA